MLLSNTRKRGVLSLLASFAILLPSFVSAQSITLVNQGLQLNYSQPVRLEQVLNDTRKTLGYAPYALGAVLSNPTKQADVEQLKQKVLAELDTLANAEAKELKTQLLALNYVAREFINLDLDLIRVSPKQNPMLAGSYHLRVAKMPTSIRILGLLPQPQVLSIQSGVSVDSYLEPLECFDVGDMRRPYIIQPDGNIIQADSSYWHNKRYYAAPGALVFIGYKDKPDLNQQIAQLLRYVVEK